jgi:hypothetical protein
MASPDPASPSQQAIRMSRTPRLRRSVMTGSKMCVRRQDRQRARSGHSRAVAPPSSRITRSRPCPHRASRPVPHDGQASRPPARSAEAAAASAHSSTAGLPDHDGHDARARAPRARGARVAACPAQNRPATQAAPDVSNRHSEHRRESRHRPGQHELPGAHGVVAHENGHRPPGSDRHAHARRRQPSSTRSERTARNRQQPAPRHVPAQARPGTSLISRTFTNRFASGDAAR